MGARQEVKKIPENMPRSSGTRTPPNPEYIKMFYDHQYDRMAKLEDQCLLLTNIVTTITLLSFTFSFDSSKPVSLETRIFLPILIIVINAFAIFYTISTREWIRLHRSRAKLLFKKYDEDLKEFAMFQEIEKTVDEDLKKRKLLREKGLGRRHIQMYLHVTFMILSLIPIVLYLTKINW